MTPVVHLKLWIFPRIFKKIQHGPNWILWGWGETDSWKNLKSKISWHCPFKDSKIRGSYLDQKLSTFVKIFDFYLMTHLFWDHEINYFFISNKNTRGNKNLSTLLARKIASIIPSKYLFCLATICLYVFHFVGTFLYIIMCDPPSWPIILQIKFKLGFT
jgi:hypothetical protein